MVILDAIVTSMITASERNELSVPLGGLDTRNHLTPSPSQRRLSHPTETSRVSTPSNNDKQDDAATALVSLSAAKWQATSFRQDIHPVDEFNSTDATHSLSTGEESRTGGTNEDDQARSDQGDDNGDEEPDYASDNISEHTSEKGSVTLTPHNTRGRQANMMPETPKTPVVKVTSKQTQARKSLRVPVVAPGTSRKRKSQISEGTPEDWFPQKLRKQLKITYRSKPKITGQYLKPVASKAATGKKTKAQEKTTLKTTSKAAPRARAGKVVDSSFFRILNGVHGVELIPGQLDLLQSGDVCPVTEEQWVALDQVVKQIEEIGKAQGAIIVQPHFKTYVLL
jgi:hypothetical protein